MPEAILTDVAGEVEYSKLTNLKVCFFFFLKSSLPKFSFLNLHTYKHTSVRRKLIEHGQLFMCNFLGVVTDPPDPCISNSNRSSPSSPATILTWASIISNCLYLIALIIFCSLTETQLSLINNVTHSNISL